MHVPSECDASDWFVVITFTNETGTSAYCFDNKSAGEREKSAFDARRAGRYYRVIWRGRKAPVD